MEERFELIRDRIREITDEKRLKEPFRRYFQEVASFLIVILDLAKANKDKELRDYVRRELKERSVEELLEENHALYRKLSEEEYESGFLNPSYAVRQLGGEYGRLLSFLYAEMYAAVPYAYEILYQKDESLMQLVIRAELFVEIYGSFCQACEESGYAQKESGHENDAHEKSGQVREKSGQTAEDETIGLSADADANALPAYEELKETVYWFISDYAQPLMEQRIEERVNPQKCFAAEIIAHADLETPHYLFAFGEYIADNQLRCAEYLAARKQETIRLMADTYTEGYRIGFVKGNKDLSKKKVVQIVYPLGFERMIREAIGNFEEMGLEPTIVRTPHSIFHKRGTALAGYYSDCPNRQFAFDHREDEALFLDKRLTNRKLEIVRESYEHRKQWAAYHAGPAWVEVFGERKFEPVMKKEACTLSKKQQELTTAYYAKQGQIVNEYIKGEERSFTIIAFPVPEIGEHYEQIMERTIALNTLDYEAYETMQQCMIDALDRADYVCVKGRNHNETDMKVMLCKLTDPDKQTKFENCVADVNIPVGEVFTSPVLAGTNGLLHVGKVYLNGLEFRDLRIRFADGKIAEYSCGNFDTEEKNRSYISEHILFHHETLPLGEFAIGTNTTAYVMGREFGISDQLPILIAEKTGPHFAVGDTCYSHAEDIAVYNADGKEIIARDNEISILRKTDLEKAYFQCHTDITIPFEELGSLYGVTKDGVKIPVIEDGRFVMKGTEALNEPLDRYDR